jgi:hypothetical protein
MHETKEGEGTLKTLTPPQMSYRVAFRFEIFHKVFRKPGFPTVSAQSDSRGTVRALNGTPLPEGVYQLDADDAEILRVSNVGLGIWVILSPQGF